MKNKTQNFGFQIPVIKDSDFFLGEGNLPRIVLQENGNWKDSLPEAEKQLRGVIDSTNCVAFASTEQIEVYEYKAFGERNNYSDRFVALVSGTTAKGNDPAKVYGAIRDFGLVPEEMCPWSDDIQTIQEYLSWKGVDKDACIAEGKKWKERKDFLHNWVFQMNQPLDEKLNNMKVALRYSPICFDVSAWQTNSEGRYIRFGLSGHWTMGYNIGDYIDVRDSYPPHEKQLVKDFNFYFCKRISITKKIPLTTEQKKSIWQSLILFFRAFLSPQDSEEAIKKLEPLLDPNLPISTPSPPIQPSNLPIMPIKTNKEILLDALPKWIGTDLSPDNMADKSLSCAEGLSNGLHSLFPSFPKGIVSTANLKRELSRSPLFKPTLTPKAGVVVVSPRTENTNGHAGCFFTDTRIISNDSATGLMQENYSWENWIKVFRDGRGLRTFLYELK